MSHKNMVSGVNEVGIHLLQNDVCITGVMYVAGLM